MGRRLGRSALSLTIDAILNALADAGLTMDQVDGLVTYPGGGTAFGAAFSGPALIDVCDALGLRPRFLLGNFEGPAQLGPIASGSFAVSGGMARHVVVYRTVTEGSARHEARAAPGVPGPAVEWITAFGGGPAPIGYALLAQRHFHEFGTTREQLGQIALNARAARGAEPAGRLDGPPDPPGLPGGTDDRVPALPLRLRRPL